MQPLPFKRGKCLINDSKMIGCFAQIHVYIVVVYSCECQVIGAKANVPVTIITCRKVIFPTIIICIGCRAEILVVDVYVRSQRNRQRINVVVAGFQLMG